MNECLVCERIPPQEVFEYAHKIFKDEPKLEIHRLAVKAIRYINYVDKTNRIFFCGRSKYQLLASLFYLLAFEREGRFLNACDNLHLVKNLPETWKIDKPKHYGMNVICWCFPSKSVSSPTCEHITETALARNKNRWLEFFPNLFPFYKWLVETDNADYWRQNYD